jgi:branched-subunit amino acid aminotransferase/4-amino-4-deoxychorismate lyase
VGRVIVFRAQGATLQRLDVDANTLDEATLKTAHGVYTVFAVYPGRRVLRLNHHLQRIRRSAELLEHPYRMDDSWLREMLRRAVMEGEQSSIATPRIRLTIPFEEPDSALIAMEPFSAPPKEIYETGVRVGLVNAHRDNPRAKNSRFVEQRQHLIAQADRDYYEVMLCLEDGTILEGAGSNFYAVLHGELRTAEEGVLPGIARGILLEVAAEIIPVNQTPIRDEDIPRLSEALLTSASRGPVPIVQIGDTVVNGGVPGPIYRRLKRHYDELVQSDGTTVMTRTCLCSFRSRIL